MRAASEASGRSVAADRLKRELSKFADSIAARAEALGHGELGIRIVVQDGVPKLMRFTEDQSVRLV